MKLLFIFVIVTLFSQFINGNSAHVPGIESPTTTPKTWRKKLSDGMSKFFQGAAILGAVQEAISNGKRGKHKSLHTTSFGAIVLAIRITNVDEALLIGDINQLPYIDRNNLFDLHYCRPNSLAVISKELLCTHRHPMDVAYALSEVYKGIYSSNLKVRSLELRKYSGAQIAKDLESTLYLVHTQKEKERLKDAGYGTGKGSRTLTIHEAQGLTSEKTIIVRTESRNLNIFSSISHAVVAVSRHRGRCVYYTDYSENDAIARFVRRAETATTEVIKDENLKMAIWDRNNSVINAQTAAGFHRRDV